MIVDNQGMHLNDPLAWPLLQPTMPPVPRQRAHVAIVTPAMADLIESGDKTIESRLSKVRGPAFDQVHGGDLIYFRESGGGFRISAKVDKALHVRDLSRAGLTTIREVFGDAIGANASYWCSKRGSRYATLIWLTDVRANLEGPALWRWPGFRDRSAWGTRELEPERVVPSRLIPERIATGARVTPLRRRA